MSDRHADRSRSFSMILYEEDEIHMKVLDFVIDHFNYAFIKHDKDVWDKDVIDDATGQILYKQGDKKKSHFHVIIDFPNARSRRKVQDMLGIDFLMTCNFYFYCRYLIHEDNPEKFQYSKEEIETNMLERVYNAIGREYRKEDQETRLLYNYIKERNFVSLVQLTDYAIENNLLYELKKNFYFYKSFCSY